MTHQERILKLAREKIVVFSRGSMSWGKSFRATFITAIDFTLANLWIPVTEELPEFTQQNDYAQKSEPVLIKADSGVITRALYFELKGEVPATGWLCIDAGFRTWSDNVTHWMPIPMLKKEDIDIKHGRDEVNVFNGFKEVHIAIEKLQKSCREAYNEYLINGLGLPNNDNIRFNRR